MKIPNTNFPCFEFSGSYREIGRQYGEECREMIRHMLDWWYENLEPIMPGVPITKMVDATKAFITPIRDYAPDLYAELEGIAEGSGLSLAEIIFHQGTFEMDVAGPVYLGGCTAFAASGDATEGGKTIAGQHFDWYSQSDLVVMRIKPTDGPSFLTVTLAGQLGQFGISELGLAHYANVLAWPKCVAGVPAVVVAQNVLRQKNMGDAIRAITQAKNGIALNHLLADKDGAIIDVEATPDKCGIVEPDNDILTHSNHFLTPYLQPDDMGDQTSFPDTFLRQYRLKQLMNKHYGKLTPKIMMELMQDHRGYPDSICRHLDMDGPIFERFETTISMISLPAEGKMYISPRPCEAPFELYTL